MKLGRIARSALKALSYPDLNIKKNYKSYRQIIRLTHVHFLRPFYTIWDHKVDGGDHEIPVRIFSPKKEGEYPILLFFHGGGWVTGDIDSYNKVCANLAKHTGHMVVSVDYRLAPEHKFPAGLEDCYRVAREIFLDNGLLNVHSRDITLIGDSAGGNLAAALSLLAKQRGEFMPERQILIYPATYFDHSEQSPFDSVRENGTGYLLTSKRINDYLDLYKNSDDDLQNPCFAPLLAPDLSGQPKTLIITAELDPLRDEGEAYGRRLKQAGVPVKVHRIPEALHGFFSLPPTFPQVKRCYQLINAFLEEVAQRGKEQDAPQGE